jgi:cysteine synthase
MPYNPASRRKTGQLGQAGSCLAEGIGEDFLPPIADLSPVRHALSIPDEESLMTARALLRDEAIVVDGDRFLGLITPIEVLNFLRRKLR